MPGEGERIIVPASAIPVIEAAKLERDQALARAEAAESELREVREALDRAQSEERGQRFARYAAESERDGMKILAGRAADDVARFASALTEALDAIDRYITTDEGTRHLEQTAARIRSQIEGSNYKQKAEAWRADQQRRHPERFPQIEGSNDE